MGQMNNTMNPSNLSFIRIQILYLIIFSILFSIIFSSPKALAINADVSVHLGEDDMNYIYNPNSSTSVYVSGNVTCDIDGFGETFQRVEVTLWVSDNRNWYPGIAPSVLTFYANGKKSFNISYIVPTSEYNNTKNTITVDGSYITEPYDSKLFGSSGSVSRDQLNVTVVRIMEPIPKTEYQTGGEKPNFWQEYSWLIVIIEIITPIIIALIIIYFYLRKRDLEDELLRK